MKTFKGFLMLVALFSACSPAFPDITSALSQAINIPTSLTQLAAPTFTPLTRQSFSSSLSQTFISTAKPTQASAPTSVISHESNLLLDRVAQLGGSINGISVVGEVAFRETYLSRDL